MPIDAARQPHPGLRFTFGLAASILIHALLLTVLRPPAPVTTVPPAWWSAPVTVRLLPKPPEPVAEPKAPAEPERPVVVRPERPAARPKKPPEAIYAPSPRRTPDAASRPAERPEPSQPGAGPDTAPRFDPEAAKAAARDIASELDEPKSDAPNAQVRNGPRYRETKEQRLAREIKQSARPNCKDGIPGGLLAPLYLMMDKKDSGCKW
jgi:outer membrane biosynthesis protein TonB